MEKSLSMSGGQLYCQAYWQQLLQYIIDGKLDPTWEFTHRFTLDQIPRAYDMFAHRKDNIMKAIVYTPFGLEWERQHASRFRPLRRHHSAWLSSLRSSRGRQQHKQRPQRTVEEEMCRWCEDSGSESAWHAAG